MSSWDTPYWYSHCQCPVSTCALHWIYPTLGVIHLHDMSRKKNDKVSLENAGNHAISCPRSYDIQRHEWWRKFLWYNEVLRQIIGIQIVYPTLHTCTYTWQWTTSYNTWLVPATRQSYSEDHVKQLMGWLTWQWSITTSWPNESKQYTWPFYT